MSQNKNRFTLAWGRGGKCVNFLLWGQSGGPSLTCHPKGSGSHLVAHQTPIQYQPILLSQGPDPAGAKKETQIHSGPQSEKTLHTVQDGENHCFVW